MQTYLQLVAEDLNRRCNGHFENLTVVFPNKRASLFLDQHLFALAGHPVWAPRYTSISELFQSLSTLTVADPIQLVCMLYKAYQESGGGTDTETLDQFWSWGELMLSDFQDIDNNMVNARNLFVNIADIDDLTSFDFLTPEQIEALRHFFPTFNETSLLKERFLNVWHRLLPTYERFRQMLLAENLCYEGMLKRQVVEKGISDGDELQGRQFAIVGFNVLNETERRLFRHLKQEAETLFYWDYDNLYMKRGENTFEAGRFIQQNIADFGNDLADPRLYDNFARPKHIHFIASPTETAQTRHAGSVLQTLKQTEMTAVGTASSDTAVVLCNESLLQPMLHAIPSDTEANITMGFPMTGTPVSSLLLALMDLQLRGLTAKRDAWRYNAVATVLKHPLIYATAGDVGTRLFKQMKSQHILFPTPSFFAESPFLSLVFTPQADVAGMLAWLIDIVQQMGRQPLSPLDTESVFDAFTLLNRLQRIHEQGLLLVQPITLQRLLMQIVKARTIPFHGEPAVGMQVMGILETRNLDFRNVLMLSVGEGNLPRLTSTTSFIPYNLREAYGMTTIERQTSLFAYYFYRLLQRAENVWLYYNNSTEGTTRGEMSRFMMQLLTDYTTSPITQQTLTAGYVPDISRTLSVEKTPAVLDQLHARFTEPDEQHPDGRMLSPSAINAYINCPLQFYLRYVARLRLEDEVTEEIGNDVFGNIFHYCMEHIWRDRIGLGREVQAHELCTLANNKEGLGHLVDEGFNVKFFHRPESEKHRPPRYNGEQLLNREVLVTYVESQLRYDARLCPLTVLGVEEKVRLGTLGGVIDRIDLATIDGETRLRIVDYKTSSSAEKPKDIAHLFDHSDPNRPKQTLQAFYYADLYTTLHPQRPVAPSLMYVKLARGTNPKRQSLPLIAINSGKDPVTDFAHQCKDEFHQRLQQVIDQIYDPAVPFTQDTTLQACRYCDFAQLCGRQKNEE